ncbi:hypothetical protein [Nitratiruptor sp. YY09-18]|uniref:hypothetical protein n=1 Tax=Nitratiruptor sp. YY09-18 TaxID=2724901 RepID=UPI001915B8B4|nr:hypothetical protein [Nitratiruptor sp. YY09-18]BCD68260.1 hypothetical protein NitYY0918_C1171 [Nitratiruptor sp. YY09-18]
MKNCRAHMAMEERYARLEIDYTSIEEKKKICNLVNDLIAKYHISPQITVEPATVETGEYVIEFHDDYDKKAGPFFEELLASLGIKKCD